MAVLVAVEQVTKQFPLAGGNSYLALQGINLEIQRGEFISFIGHSGCGKSTLLNMIAGLDQPTQGQVWVEGRLVQQPGPDRMVVFQNYSLLPWLTVWENIALAVEEVLGHLPPAEQRQIIQHHIDLVGLTAAKHKLPAHLSGGMRQRVAIARVLAIRPQVLLLDEPFGALDALTRGNLQEQLMRICEEHRVTTVMVTHDVDEAVFLSDRIVMLTNGPGAHIGNILTVDIPRPRRRMEVVKHPSYYSLRSEIIYFLHQQKRIKKMRSRSVTAVARHGLEKVNLELGFVPLIACAPLAVAQEEGLFAKHGLDEVHLVRETSWRGIVDGLVGGYLDGAQTPAGLPVWLTLGGHQNKPVPVVSGLTMTRNGNGITLAKKYYQQGIHTASQLRNYLQEQTQPPMLGIVHPASMHNLLLRYWLAAAGIDPDRDVRLKTMPPAQMVADLKAGTIDGYCVGEPWNVRAALEGLGFTVATDQELWLDHPGKVLGVREDWAMRYPNTHIALVKALLEACHYCDQPQHREEIRHLLARPEYLGMDVRYIYLGEPGKLTCELNQPEYAHHRFYGEGLNRPSRTEHLWIMTQLARWGDVPFPRNWLEILERVCRVNVFTIAARELGLLGTAQTSRSPIRLFDGSEFTSHQDSIDYLNHLAIKRDFSVAEIVLDRPQAA
jgi:bicarbonate transport system ATP-binding protein